MKLIRYISALFLIVALSGGIAQSALISGSSDRNFAGECGSIPNITFNSDDPNSRMTRAVIDITGIGVFIQGLCGPSSVPMTATISGWGTSVLTIDFMGFEPGETFAFGSSENDLGHILLNWKGGRITVTIDSVCTFEGLYSQSTNIFESHADFGGICGETPIFIDPQSLEFTVSQCGEWDTKKITITNNGQDSCEFDIESSAIPFEGLENTDPHKGTIGPAQSVEVTVYCSAKDQNGNVLLPGEYEREMTVIISNLDPVSIPVHISVESCENNIPEFPVLLVPLGLLVGLFTIVMIVKGRYRQLK